MAGFREGHVRWPAIVIASLATLVGSLALNLANAHAKPFYGFTGQFEPDDLGPMRAAGATTLATLLNWRVVQRDGPESFNWSDTDAVFAEAAKEKIEVIPILFGSATFISDEIGRAPVGSPEAEERWRRFVMAAVERYGPGGEFWQRHQGPVRPVRAWQVWQEPGLTYFFKPKPSPKKYVKLLKLTSKTIRATDPEATILLGGFNDPKGGTHISLKSFLKRFYRAGGKGIRRHYDVLSLHAYGTDNRGILRKLVTARKAMRDAGDRKTPVWVTELGWSSASSDTHRLMVGRAGQKKKLRDALRMLKQKRKRFRIRRVFVYSWRDVARESDCWCDTAGLVDLDGNPKPALKVFERFANG